MEMLFTINPRPHPSTYANTNVESFSSLPNTIQDSDPHQEEIDLITRTDDVLPQSVDNNDSDGEVDVVDDLRINNSIQNSEHEYSESEDSDFDNPLVPLPPPEPPDEEFDVEIDFGVEILVMRNTIVKFECIDARVKFDIFNDENDDLSYFMVTTIEEQKDLTSLSLDEIIRNLKFHEMIIKKDSEILKAKGERRSLALKAKKSRDDKNGKGGRKCFICGDPNHLIGECPKPPRDNNQRAFVGGSWSDSGEEVDEKIKDETCLVAQASNETSPLVDDDLDEEEAIKATEKKNLENVVEDETLEIDEVVNIKESKNHPLKNVIGNLNQRTLRSQAQNQSNFFCFISTIEPKNVNEVLTDESSTIAMQEELNQFITKDVWELVPQPRNMTIIRTKCAFLNGLINEEVYVAQPPRFIDFEKPDHVYKLKKALCGLKQAPKAWYDRLKAFLIKHEYKMGMVDNILFAKKRSSNLIIVQIYVDDIIFGSTCQDMCDKFSKIMHDEFEMSMMGELNFFLGLQIKQMEDGIFFNQSTYIKEMIKKFGLEDSKPMKTPMSSDIKLTKNKEFVSVDSTKYQGIIGSFLYLTTSRPDIMFSVCLCARFQEAPKKSHLEAVKRIFQYIKGTTHLGLWYAKGTDIETVVYADSDHAGD
nr:copia protein [Tanacetum cinerariifolium]